MGIFQNFALFVIMKNTLNNGNYKFYSRGFGLSYPVTNAYVRRSPYPVGAASRYVSSSSSKPGRSAYRVCRRTPNGERHVLGSD